MKNRILSAVLIFCLLFAAFPLWSVAATPKNGTLSIAGTGLDAKSNPLKRDVTIVAPPTLSWYMGQAGDAYAAYDGDPKQETGILSRATNYGQYIEIFNEIFAGIGMPAVKADAGAIPDFDVRTYYTHASGIPTVSTTDGYVTRTCLGVARKTAAEADTYQYVYSYTLDPTKREGYTGPDNIPTIVLTAGTQAEEKCAIYGTYWFVRDILQNADTDTTGYLSYYREHVKFIIIPCLTPSGMNDNTYWNAGNVNICRNMDVNNWYSRMNEGGYNQDGTPNIHGQYTQDGKPSNRTQNSGYAPFDQPEACIIRDLLLTNKEETFLYIDFHTCTGAALGPATNYWEKLNWLAVRKTKNPYYNKLYEAAERQLAAMKYNLKEEFDLPYSMEDTVGAIANSLGERTVSEWALEAQGIFATTMEGFGGFVGDATYGYSGDVQRANSELIGNYFMQILHTYYEVYEEEETPDPAYTTSFESMNENFPTVEGLDVNVIGYYDTTPLLHTGYAKELKEGFYPISYRNGWQIGYKMLSPDGYTFTDDPGNFAAYKAYSFIETVNAGTAYEAKIPRIVYAGSQEFYGAGGKGSLWLNRDFQSISGFSKTSGEWSADPTIRYTAEYSGTVQIHIRDVLFYAQTGEFVVMHNGNAIGSIKGAARSSMWVIENGVWNGITNIVGEEGTFTVNVTKGDTLDFVCHNDPRGVDPDRFGEIKGSDGKALTKINYDNAKRGVRDFHIDISYYEYSGDLTSSYTGLAANEITITNPGTLTPFFDSFKEGQPVKVNAAWIKDENGEPRTLQEAYDAFISYLRTVCTITPKGDWQAGAMEGGAPQTAGTNFARFSHYGFLAQTNILFGGGANGQYSKEIYGYQQYVSKTQFEKQLAQYVSNIAPQLAADGNKNAADLVYATTDFADLSTVPDFFNKGSWIPTAASRIDGTPAEYRGVMICPHQAGGTGAAAYVVPAGVAGTATLHLDALLFAPNANGKTYNNPFSWNIACNGTYVWEDFIDYDPASNTVEDINAILDTYSSSVKTGDTLAFCVRRGTGALRISPALTVTVKNVGSSAPLSLVEAVDVQGTVQYRSVHSQKTAASDVLADIRSQIADFGANGFAYAGRFYAPDADPATLPAFATSPVRFTAYHAAVPVCTLGLGETFRIYTYLPDNGAVAAGLSVDGTHIPAARTPDGRWKVMVAAVDADELLDVSYTVIPTYIYQNGIQRGQEITVSPAMMLQTYETTGQDTVKALAKATRLYAEAARAYFGHGELSSESKTALQAVDNGLLAANKTLSYAVSAGDVYGFTSATLSLQDSVQFVLRLTALQENATPLENCRVKVTVDGETTFVDTFTTVTVDGVECPAVILTGFSALDIMQDVQITVTDIAGHPLSGELTYSVSTYCARQFAPGEDHAVQDLLRALYLLGAAAEAYTA